MDYKQTYLKYKQKYSKLLKDQKGGEPFLTDLQAKQAYLWLFAKNQRQLQLIFGQNPIRLLLPLGNITLNHQHRLSLMTKGYLSVLLSSRLIGPVRLGNNIKLMHQLAKCIMSRLHIVPRISPPTCVATIRHTRSVNSVAFHAVPLLATGSEEGSVKLWDCSNPQIPPTLLAELTEHISYRDQVSSIALHPTLPLLAIGTYQGNLILWNCTYAENPTLIVNLTDHIVEVNSVAFHPTLPLLASGSDSSFKLWNCPDAQNPPTLLATIEEYTGVATLVAFHPTLPLLASSSDNNTIKLWDCSNPNIPTPIADLTEHTDSITPIADLTEHTDSITPIADLTEHTDSITSVAFHPTLPLFASGSKDKTIKLWNCQNAQNPPILLATIQEHTDIVNSVVFHPTLSLLASGSDDRTVKLWDCSIPQIPILVANLTDHTYHVMSVAFHSTLHLLATGSVDRSVKLWQL